MAQPNAKQPDPTVSATASTSDFVFVENTTSGFREILYANTKAEAAAARSEQAATKPAPPSSRRVTTPGLNVVPTDVWLEASNAGACIDQLESFGLIEVEPTKIRTGEAIDLARRSTARDALKRWQAIERRPEVLAAIAERLARVGKRTAA